MKFLLSIDDAEVFASTPRPEEFHPRRSHSNGGWVREIAKKAGMTQAKTRKILLRLEEQGLVVAKPAGGVGRYRLWVTRPIKTCRRCLTDYVVFSNLEEFCSKACAEQFDKRRPDAQ